MQESSQRRGVVAVRAAIIRTPSHELQNQIDTMSWVLHCVYLTRSFEFLKTICFYY